MSKSHQNTRKIIAAGFARIQKLASVAEDLQADTLNRLENMEQALYELEKTTKNNEKELVDQKFDSVALRRVINSFGEAIRRFNQAIQTYKDSDGDFSLFYKALVEDVCQYAEAVSEDLSWVHQAVSPENLDEHMGWYIHNIGKAYNK